MRELELIPTEWRQLVRVWTVMGVALCIASGPPCLGALIAFGLTHN